MFALYWIHKLWIIWMARRCSRTACMQISSSSLSLLVTRLHDLLARSLAKSHWSAMWTPSQNSCQAISFNFAHRFSYIKYVSNHFDKFILPKRFHLLSAALSERVLREIWHFSIFTILSLSIELSLSLEHFMSSSLPAYAWPKRTGTTWVCLPNLYE